MDQKPTRRQLLKTLGLAAAVPAVAAAAVQGSATEPNSTADRDPAVVTDAQRDLVCYCGLYCGLCSGHGPLRETSRALLETLRMDEAPVPEEVRAYLATLAEVPPGKCCRRDQCGHPRCAIRKCARDRQVQACPFCGDYPCDRIRTLAASEPTLLHDGGRMKGLGLEPWIREQEGRRARGFCYSQVRCLPCTIPTD